MNENYFGLHNQKAQSGAKFNFRRNKGILVAMEINTIFEYSF